MLLYTIKLSNLVFAWIIYDSVDEKVVIYFTGFGTFFVILLYEKAWRSCFLELEFQLHRLLMPCDYICYLCYCILFFPKTRNPITNTAEMPRILESTNKEISTEEYYHRLSSSSFPTCHRWNVKQLESTYWQRKTFVIINFCTFWYR